MRAAASISSSTRLKSRLARRAQDEKIDNFLTAVRIRDIVFQKWRRVWLAPPIGGHAAGALGRGPRAVVARRNGETKNGAKSLKTNTP